MIEHQFTRTLSRRLQPHRIPLASLAGMALIAAPMMAQIAEPMPAFNQQPAVPQMSSAAQAALQLKNGRRAPAHKGDTLSQALSVIAVGLTASGAPGAELAALASNAAGFFSPFQVNIADTKPADTQSETTITLGAGSVVLIAYNDSSTYGPGQFHFTGWARSTDGGQTFISQPPLPTTPDGDAGDPVLARDNTSGTIYLSTLAFDLSEIHVFRSFDNGATFGSVVSGSPGTAPGGLEDKPWITVDNFAGPCRGNVYLGWREFNGSNSMKFTRSTDGGATFGPSGGISMASGGQGAFPVVGPDHAVYYFWWSGNLLMKKSTDCGQTFGPAVVVTPPTGGGTNGDLALNGGFRTSAFPQAAVNPVNGNLYIVYNVHGAGADKSDVLFRQSTDGGATWSAAMKVNDDTTSNDQWMPALSVTPDGKALAVGFYDRRIDPGNSLIDRYVAVADINGAVVTFRPNQRLTTQSFPVVIGQDPIVNEHYMGDYDQIVCDAANNLYMPWGDNQNPDLAHPHQPDVFFLKSAVGTSTSALGVAVSSVGSTLVSDTANNRVLVFDSAGNLRSQIGSFGSGPGQLNQPSGLALTSTGLILVADTGNNRVEVFDSAGNYRAAFGAGQLSQPFGVAVGGNGYIWVTDSGHNRIAVFDSVGNFKAQIGSAGTGSGGLEQPAGIALTTNGLVAVADTGNHRVQVFDMFGNSRALIGVGQLNRPLGVAIASNGNFDVADTANNRAVVFNSAGAFVSQFGSAGSGPGQFINPSAVSAASTGLIVVLDEGNNRVEVFDLNGSLRSQFIL